MKAVSIGSNGVEIIETSEPIPKIMNENKHFGKLVLLIN